MRCFSSSSSPLYSAGFTLIELMVVVAIVAIITAIAVPAYNSQVSDARRADCVAVLEESRQVAERFYAKNFSYAGAQNDDNFPDQAPKQGTASCNITAVTAANTFTITASPTGAHANDRCGNLSITNTGTRNATGGTVDDCF